MKVWIDTDERYPDYLVSTEGDTYSEVIDVDEETLARWEKAQSDYDARALEIFMLLRPRT
jgi:hypothetical protein